MISSTNSLFDLTSSDLQSKECTSNTWQRVHQASTLDELPADVMTMFLSGPKGSVEFKTSNVTRYKKGLFE